MSWQDYVDKQLVASGFVNHAAIIGNDGALWAKSANFNVSRPTHRFFFIFPSLVDVSRQLAADGCLKWPSQLRSSIHKWEMIGKFWLGFTIP